MLSELKIQNKRAEVEFFDKFDIEGGYDVFDDIGYKKIVSILKGNLKSFKPKKILDLGCGSGAFTARLSAAFPKSDVIGIDISGGIIKRAKISYPNIKFEVGDIEKTKYKPNSIDLICYTGILHHFPDFSNVAKEGYRILKPGGHFFSYDPNKYNPAFWLYRSPNSPLSTRVGITDNERLLTSDEIIRIFEKVAFKVKTQIISGITVNYVENEKARPLLSVYNLFDKVLGATPIVNVFGAWILGFGTKE